MLFDVVCLRGTTFKWLTYLTTDVLVESSWHDNAWHFCKANITLYCTLRRSWWRAYVWHLKKARKQVAIERSSTIAVRLAVNRSCAQIPTGVRFHQVAVLNVQFPEFVGLGRRVYSELRVFTAVRAWVAQMRSLPQSNPWLRSKQPCTAWLWSR